jgi:hypothetical protein
VTGADRKPAVPAPTEQATPKLLQVKRGNPSEEELAALVFALLAAATRPRRTDPASSQRRHAWYRPPLRPATAWGHAGRTWSGY